MLSLHYRSICSQVFGKVSNQIALHRHTGGAPREAGGRGGVDPGSPIHEVGIETGLLDLVLGKVTGQLMDNGPNHFQMTQFLGPNIGQKTFEFWVGHCIALAQIS